MKKRRVFTIVCALVLLCAGLQATAGSAADTGSGADTQWISYTNGNWINGVAVDSGGSIWAASSGGAVRWDAAAQTYEKFTSEHGLCSNQLSAAAAAPDGAVWLASLDNGISCYRDGAFATYTVRDGLPSNVVQDIAAAPDGSVWAATYLGVSRFDGKTWQTYDDGPGRDIIDEVVCAPDGSVWFAAKQQGLFRLSGSGWTLYDEAAGLSNMVMDLTLAADGSVLASFYNVGLVRFSGDAFAIVPTGDSIFSYDSVYYIDEVGRLWAASGQAMGCLNGGKWEYFGGDNTLPMGFDTTSILSGSDGTVWFGGFRGGLSGYRDGRWTVLKTDDWLPDNALQSVTVTEEGNLWLTSETAVTYYDWETAQVYPLRRSAQKLIVMPDSAVYLSLRNSGLYRFDGAQWAYLGPGNANNGFQDGVAVTTETVKIGGDIAGNEWFTKLLTDRDGSLLCVSNMNRVRKLNGVQWSAFQTPVYAVFDLALSQRGVYWATSDDGLFSSADGKNWAQHPRISDANYMAYDVGALYIAPDGACWIGGSSGVGCQPAQGDSFYFVSGDTVPSDEAACIAGEPDGAVWIGTRDCWSMTGGSGAAVYRDGVWTPFTASDGLSSNAVSGIAVTEGDVWFATLGGLSRYNADPAQ
ncbi:MAG: hypothetical protein JW811_02670 [Clostridiales bacterium]|nr:hypothetical protein [Clostridiales bacterium]